MRVRPARVEECALLTELAMRSKAHWGYDDAFMAACRDELTVRPSWIPRIDVAEDGEGRVVGMIRLEADELEDVFVDPAAIGAGVGRLLFEHALERAWAEGMRVLRVTADPHALGFYTSMGMQLIGEEPSGSIPGRMLPRLELLLRRGT